MSVMIQIHRALSCQRSAGSITSTAAMVLSKPPPTRCLRETRVPKAHPVRIHKVVHFYAEAGVFRADRIPGVAGKGLGGGHPGRRHEAG